MQCTFHSLANPRNIINTTIFPVKSGQRRWNLTRKLSRHNAESMAVIRNKIRFESLLCVIITCETHFVSWIVKLVYFSCRVDDFARRGSKTQRWLRERVRLFLFSKQNVEIPSMSDKYVQFMDIEINSAKRSSRGVFIDWKRYPRGGLSISDNFSYFVVFADNYL